MQRCAMPWFQEGVPWSCELILKYRQNPEETYTCEGVHYFVKIETSFLLKMNLFTQTFCRIWLRFLVGPDNL